MKKLVSVILGLMVVGNVFAFGFKIKLDNTYTSRFMNGEWITSDTIASKSMITINNEANWIYFNTANSFYNILNKDVKDGWHCKDSKGRELFINITREENNDAYITITYPDHISWAGRIVIEKPVWKPIRRPFGIHRRIRPEVIPIFY